MLYNYLIVKVQFSRNGFAPSKDDEVSIIDKTWLREFINFTVAENTDTDGFEYINEIVAAKIELKPHHFHKTILSFEVGGLGHAWKSVWQSKSLTDHMKRLFNGL